MILIIGYLKICFSFIFVAGRAHPNFHAVTRRCDISSKAAPEGLERSLPHGAVPTNIQNRLQHSCSHGRLPQSLWIQNNRPKEPFLRMYRTKWDLGMLFRAAIVSFMWEQSVKIEAKVSEMCTANPGYTVVRVCMCAYPARVRARMAGEGVGGLLTRWGHQRGSPAQWGHQRCIPA